MIAFVDSSVVWRLLFGEPKPLREWARIEEAYASRLLVVEVSRVIDRVRLHPLRSEREIHLLHPPTRFQKRPS